MYKFWLKKKINQVEAIDEKALEDEVYKEDQDSEQQVDLDRRKKKKKNRISVAWEGASAMTGNQTHNQTISITQH